MEQVNRSRRRATLALLRLPAIVAAGGLCGLGALAARADDAPWVDLPKFSVAPAGNRLPAGWTHQTLPSVERANRFDLQPDQGGTVLRVLSDRSASTLAVSLRVDPALTPLLKWRWRVSNAVAASDLRR
jgi:hypothetical protein